jgi:hypothetical protein
VGNDQLASDERAPDVYAIEQVPVTYLHVLDGAGYEDGGIVDENVYSTERVDGLLNEVFHVCLVAQVGWHGADFSALLGYFFGDFVKLFSASRRDDNLCAFSSVSDSDRSANAAPATGNNNDFIFQLHNSFLQFASKP